MQKPGKSRIILERSRARQRNGGQAYTLDKTFVVLLIHHFTVIIPCLLICEMCRSDPCVFLLPLFRPPVQKICLELNTICKFIQKQRISQPIIWLFKRWGLASYLKLATEVVLEPTSPFTDERYLSL